jgi:hypothetical protein
MYYKGLILKKDDILISLKKSSKKDKEIKKNR